MKKSRLFSMVLTVLLTSAALLSNATTTDPSIKTTPIETPELKAMVSRLNEIDKMDKSGLSRAERKALRKEVRSIKDNVREVGGGVYISVGALLLAIILLIILL